jgi:hypothetical protein
MTKLSDLKELGAFLGAEPVRRTITFKLDGDDEYTAEIHIKKLSVGEQERLSMRSADDTKSRRAVMISELVTLGEDGKEPIPYVDAYSLHPGLGKAMIAAISQVNGVLGRKN